MEAAEAYALVACVGLSILPRRCHPTMPIKQAEPPQAHEILKSNPDAIYLDVRTEGEFAQGHPAGAINVPVVFIKGPGQMEVNADFLAVTEKTLPQGKKLVVG